MSKVKKELGRYFCENKHCSKWTEKGCLLRKVGLTCDNGECLFNVSPIPGVYQCGCMDVHLDADGKCINNSQKTKKFREGCMGELSGKEIWLCGQYKSGGQNGLSDIVWEFQGVFSTREKAVAACRNLNYFIAPVTIDKEVPDETEPIPGCEYPLRQNSLR